MEITADESGSKKRRRRVEVKIERNFSQIDFHWLVELNMWSSTSDFHVQDAVKRDR